MLNIALLTAFCYYTNDQISIEIKRKGISIMLNIKNKNAWLHIWYHKEYHHYEIGYFDYRKNVNEDRIVNERDICEILQKIKIWNKEAHHSGGESVLVE